MIVDSRDRIDSLEDAYDREGVHARRRTDAIDATLDEDTAAGDANEYGGRNIPSEVPGDRDAPGVSDIIAIPAAIPQVLRPRLSPATRFPGQATRGFATS